MQRLLFGMRHSSNVLLRIRLRLDFQQNSIRPNALRRMLSVVRVYIPRMSLTEFSSELLLEGFLQFSHDSLNLLVFEGVFSVLEDEGECITLLACL